jgi:hypothetical protein
MTPCVIVIRRGVVHQNIQCRDEQHAQQVFLEKLAECLSNWDEYTAEDRQHVLEKQYERFGDGSVSISWARTEEELLFGMGKNK